MQSEQIPGYLFGQPDVPKAPISLEELELIQKTLLFTEEDKKYLALSYDILRDQTEQILDVWYGFVGSNPHLLYFFTRKKDGQPDPDYLSRVRKRFGQWILDTAKGEYGQKWLDYQFEIGRRHHRSGKNKTDHVQAVEHISFRYLIPLVYPISSD